jgi:hypothetical protein
MYPYPASLRIGSPCLSKGEKEMKKISLVFSWLLSIVFLIQGQDSQPKLLWKFKTNG